MTIQKPTLKDIPKLIPLWMDEIEYHHTLDSEYYLPNPTDETGVSEEEKYLEKAIKYDDPFILVAKKDDDIAGFVTFEEGRADYPDTKIEHYGEVLELFVDKQYRKQGIGKQLLAAAEAHFAQRNVSWIKLQATMYNTPAIQFYERLGYENKQVLMFKKAR